MLMPLLIGSNSEWVELVGVEFSWLTGLSDRKKNEVVGRVWDVSQLVRSERSQHRSPVQQAICSLQETPSVHPLSLSLSQGRCGRRVWRRPTWRIRLGSLQFKRAGYPRSHLRQFVGKYIPSGVLVLAAGIGLVPQRPLILPPGGEQHPPVVLIGGSVFFHFRRVESHG